MSSQRRRVVVTGIGLVTPLGTSARTTFDGLLRGTTGTVPLRRAPFFLPQFLSEDKRMTTATKTKMLDELISAMPCRVVGAVREDDEDMYYYDYENRESIAKRRRLNFAPTAHEPRSFRFSEHAVEEALRDALLLPPSGAPAKQAKDNKDGNRSPLIGITDPRRVGVNIGMGIPSLSDVADVTASLTGSLHAPVANTTTSTIANNGTSVGMVHYSRINPFFVPKILGNMAAGATAIKYNCQGFIGSSVAACATGAHCIGESFMVLQQQQQCHADGSAAAFRQFLAAHNDSVHSERAAPTSATVDVGGVGTSEGIVDVMICGATEACITPVSVAGFSRMRALSTRHNDVGGGSRGSSGGPATASRPFDTSRDGFVMAEGAGILILEEYEHAKRRIGAYLAEVQRPEADPATHAAFAGKIVRDFIYGELCGFGVSSDAHHVAAPHPAGRGAEACLRSCLASAGVWKDDRHAHRFYVQENGANGAGASKRATSFAPLRIGYVNAHATGTIGDEVEMSAIRRVFGKLPVAQNAKDAPQLQPSQQEQELARDCERVYVSSSKGSMGHLLGAAGSVEAAVALMSLRTGVAPPTANLTSPCLSPERQAAEGVYLNTAAALLKGCDGVLSTSFGFGGVNTALLFTNVK